MDNSSLNADVSAESEKAPKAFPGRGFCLSLLILFYIFLFYGSLTPFEFKPVHIGWNEGVSQILATGGHIESQMDWYVNLFLGIPAGFFMLGVLCLDKKLLWSALCAAPVILVCFVMAFIVERLQLYTINRNCALSDIIAQTCGAGIGCVIWAISGQSIWDELRRVWNGSGIQSVITAFILLYFLVLIIDAWSPFNFVYALGDIWDRWKNLDVFWIPLSEHRFGITMNVISHLLLYGFLYVPMGVYIHWQSDNLKLQSDAPQSFLKRMLQNHPLVYTILLALFVSTSLTLGQFFIQNRTLYATGILLAVLTAGAGCYASGLKEPRWRLCVAIVCLCAILTAMVGYFWSPFNFSMDAFRNDNVFTVYQFIPLADYQRSHTITAINRLLTSMEFSIVITLALQYILKNVRYKNLTTLAICAFIFTLMEGGQLFLPTRTFTLSDIILQILFSAGTLKVLSIFQNIPIVSDK
ncbi:MAG: VanZ family protein [Thermoguttaceae bacterium]|nr:VanZ family protein [Thermoguttaceae bacterium]